jgi:uncharacterized protein (TIGR02757 family)
MGSQFDVDFENLKILLEQRASLYNQPSFIETDPIQAPKLFSRKGDIEISAFLAATLAWGQRPQIIKSTFNLMKLMDNSPFDFVVNSSEEGLAAFGEFRHRTFNGEDCRYFILSLRNIYLNHGGLQQVFEDGFKTGMSVKAALGYFYKIFFELEGMPRTKKHIPNVEAGSAAKRLNLFLRWMVRKDGKGVDFGLWDGIPQSALMLPLDVHTGNIARKLGLLNRRQNDWKAVEEVTSALRLFDPVDPIKYDFALFGIGAFEGI